MPDWSVRDDSAEADHGEIADLLIGVSAENPP
jgi:hypothetical protein